MMRLSPISSPVVRIASCLSAAFAAVVFALSVAFRVRMIIALGPTTPGYWRTAFSSGWPALVLLLLFTGALGMCLKGKRMGLILLMGSLLLAALLFLRDVAHGNYDIQALTISSGCKRYYLTWWWYVGPSAWERYIPNWL